MEYAFVIVFFTKCLQWKNVKKEGVNFTYAKYNPGLKCWKLCDNIIISYFYFYFLVLIAVFFNVAG